MAGESLVKLPSYEWNWALLMIEVNIVSGNGLVSPGNTPLPEPMSTQIDVAIWHHKAMMSVKSSLMRAEEGMTWHILKSFQEATQLCPW